MVIETNTRQEHTRSLIKSAKLSERPWWHQTESGQRSFLLWLVLVTPSDKKRAMARVVARGNRTTYRGKSMSSIPEPCPRRIQFV